MLHTKWMIITGRKWLWYTKDVKDCGCWPQSSSRKAISHGHDPVCCRNQSALYSQAAASVSIKPWIERKNPARASVQVHKRSSVVIMKDSSVSHMTDLPLRLELYVGCWITIIKFVMRVLWLRASWCRMSWSTVWRTNSEDAWTALSVLGCVDGHPNLHNNHLFHINMI